MAARARRTEAAVLGRLGAMPTRTFVARYWQRRPVCIRQAMPDFSAPLDRDRLFALAAHADVESRLVTAFSGRWRLRHGPVPRAALPPLRRHGWTLLVQGVDLHDDAVAALAARFRFLPLARFDDAMVSYASDGGGVGPHVDQYDVFLLQAQGRRRWRIARRYDPRCVQGLPLRVLADFRAEEEWVLEPGDLLYLPPGVAHEGVALGECMTISIGFRLPAWQEVREAWYERQGRMAAVDERRIADRTRRPTRAPARLPAGMSAAVAHGLARAGPSLLEARRTLLEHLTEPKPRVVFEPRRRALSLARFSAAARRRGVRLDLRTRMLYEGADMAVNGETFDASAGARRLLQRLADTGALGPIALCSRDRAGVEGVMSRLHDWYCAGWLHLAA